VVLESKHIEQNGASPIGIGFEFEFNSTSGMALLR